MDRYALIAVAALIGAAVLGCDDKSTTTDTRTPGQKVQTAADKTGDAVQNRIDAAGRGLSTAADKTRDATRTAAEKTSNAVDNGRIRAENTRIQLDTPPTTQPVVAPLTPQ